MIIHLELGIYVDYSSDIHYNCDDALLDSL